MNNDVEKLAWQLFKTTGNPCYYRLYKAVGQKTENRFKH